MKENELEETGLERSIYSGWCPSSDLEAVAVPPVHPAGSAGVVSEPHYKLPWVIKMTSYVFTPALWATVWNLRAPQYIESPTRWLNGPF